MLRPPWSFILHVAVFIFFPNINLPETKFVTLVSLPFSCVPFSAPSLSLAVPLWCAQTALFYQEFCWLSWHMIDLLLFPFSYFLSLKFVIARGLLSFWAEYHIFQCVRKLFNSEKFVPKSGVILHAGYLPSACFSLFHISCTYSGGCFGQFPALCREYEAVRNKLHTSSCTLRKRTWALHHNPPIRLRGLQVFELSGECALET